MVTPKGSTAPHFAVVLLLFILPCLTVFAQDDPDPNSPSPRILTNFPAASLLSGRNGFPVKGKVRGSNLQKAEIELAVDDLELMADEGANAFRVYASDKFGRQYRFPVVDINKAPGNDNLYLLKIRLVDDAGFWKEPIARGTNLKLRLTWRGLSSNLVAIEYGVAGTVKSIPDETPVVAPGVRNSLPKSTGSPDSPEYGSYRWSGDRMRFQEQAGFGPTAELDARIRRIGIRTYLAEQLEASYPSLSNPYPDLPLKNTDPNAAIANGGCGPAPSPSTAEYRICIRDFYSMYPVQTWFFREAFYGDAQLRHRATWALSQIWVISGVDTQQSSWMLAYYQSIAKNTFGNYRDLMKDLTLNPGMGNYLDMARSTKNNPNENYPREVLQLFSIGLFMLNQDGTLQLDINGNPIPTYDQNTVNNFTKVFTGWSFCNTTCTNSVPGLVNYKDPMILSTSQHDLTAKTLLSYPGSTTTNIAACSGCNTAAITTYANNSLNQTLDNIFNHPNVAPFVSRQLIQQMVTSDPSPAYVGRISAIFNNNGSGVRGDLKSVIRAILLDPEARGDLKTDPNFGKLREPVQFLTNVFRTFKVSSADGLQQSDGAVQNLPANMAQNPFYSPTVFNYYSPDYVIPGTALNGPEFGLMTTGTSIARANFVNTMVFSKISASENSPLGTSLNFAELQALSTADATGNQLLDALNSQMMHGTMSAAMRAKILPAVVAISAGSPLSRAQAAVYLVATSSQYQIQR